MDVETGKDLGKFTGIRGFILGMLAIASSCNNQGFIDNMMGYLLLSRLSVVGIELAAAGAFLGAVILPFVVFGLGIAAAFIVGAIVSDWVASDFNCGPGSGSRLWT